MHLWYDHKASSECPYSTINCSQWPRYLVAGFYTHCCASWKQQLLLMYWPRSCITILSANTNGSWALSGGKPSNVLILWLKKLWQWHMITAGPLFSCHAIHPLQDFQGCPGGNLSWEGEESLQNVWISLVVWSETSCVSKRECPWNLWNLSI